MNADVVIAATVVGLCALILLQLWRNGDDEDMELLIENGVFYLNNRRFSLVQVNDDGKPRKSGRFPVTVQYSPEFECELLRAEGFGWVGATAGCHAMLGQVRGRNDLLADVMAQERLRVLVLDALDDGKRVTLEVKP